MDADAGYVNCVYNALPLYLYQTSPNSSSRIYSTTAAAIRRWDVYADKHCESYDIVLSVRGSQGGHSIIVIFVIGVSRTHTIVRGFDNRYIRNMSRKVRQCFCRWCDSLSLV